MVSHFTRLKPEYTCSHLRSGLPRDVSPRGVGLLARLPLAGPAESKSFEKSEAVGSEEYWSANFCAANWPGHHQKLPAFFHLGVLSDEGRRTGPTPVGS